MQKPSHPSLALILSLSACSDQVPAEVETDPVETSASSETTDTPQNTDASTTTTTTTTTPATDETTGGSICGDGNIQADEQCDDSINDGAYGGCLPDCSAPAAHCGDGLLQPEGREACDNGEHNGTTTCNAWCRVSGTKLAELAAPTLSFTPSAVLATAGGRLFVPTTTTLWEARDLDTELSSAHMLELALPWQVAAMADLGDGRIAVAGGTASDHDLHVIDIEPFDRADAVPQWAYHQSLGSTGGVYSLVVVGTELWMFGDASDPAASQQARWIHRIDPYAKTWKPPIVTPWLGQNGHLYPRAIHHPLTGLIAVFQATSGIAGLGMRMSVLDPSTGEELFADQDPTLDDPSAVCLRPDGHLAVFANPQGGGPQQVVGYALDDDGELHRGTSRSLELGSGTTRLVACVAAPGANLLVGQVGDEALVLLVENLLEDDERVAWQHIGVQVGLDPKEAALGAAYRDGRFSVSLGWDTALAVFAR
jgi:hypothetical protein